MTLIAWLIYIPLQIVWLPISLIGAILVGYKQIIVSKRLGVSQTAVEIINGRWTLDVFGLREDKPSRRLAATIPNTSTFGLWLALLPLWIAQKLTGRIILYPTVPAPEKAGLANLVPSRTVEIDGLIAANAQDSAQFIVLGAGLDTRAYGPLKDSGLVVFELDQKAVQTFKRKYVTSAGIDAAHVNFVEVDFTDRNWIETLKQSPYDPLKKSIFLWEGVTLYLSETDVRETLAALKAHTVPGSVIIADIYATRFIEFGNGKMVGKVLDVTSEGLSFGLDFSRDAKETLRSFFETQGLTLGRHQFLGSDHKDGAFMVIAELVF